MPRITHENKTTAIPRHPADEESWFDEDVVSDEMTDIVSDHTMHGSGEDAVNKREVGNVQVTSYTVQ